VRKTKVLSNSDFLARVREYLPVDAEIRQTDADGKPHGGSVGADLSENDFYLFDAEAMNAFTHAIEEIALEEAKGEFLAAVQDFKQFDALKERYWQLAATLDNVEVIASGPTPRRNGHIKFCNSGKTALNNFWIMIFDGPRTQLLFLCEQANDGRAFEDKKFIGFYTFNEKVIGQARDEIVGLLAGKCPELRQFSRLHKLDQAAKQLKVEFGREQEVLEMAIRKLQDGSDKYDPKHFLRDLDKTLRRLTELKSRLPELILGH
jgi:hypothetical protein